MNTKQRFREVMHWGSPDQVPNMDFGYWDETIQLWHRQGLPSRVKTQVDLEIYLELEGFERIPTLPVNTGLHPPFERSVLEDRGERQLIRDEEGNLCEISKSTASIPHYLKYGIETREDWQRYKNERLDPNREDRIGDVQGTIAAAHAEGMPVRLSCGSLYGWLRNWMGVENLSIALITDRDWVEEMMEHLTQLTLTLIERALPGTAVDMAWWWEDMCYNHGPLMSPRLFEQLMVPRYKRITDTLKNHGIDVNFLDCDGCIYEFVPGWLRGGINCMFPIEASHTDPLRLREEYGKELLLVGGVNKVALAKGKDAIDREMDRLHPLVSQGGYIPTVDHRVPPDVSYENYLYYLGRKKEVLKC